MNYFPIKEQKEVKKERKSDEIKEKQMFIDIIGKIHQTKWKFAHTQLVPKKGDCSNSSNYRPIVLISCLSKASESVLNKEIMRHLSAHNLISDCQYGFRKGRSTGDLLAFLNESWSSSFQDLGEFLAVGLDIESLR